MKLGKLFTVLVCLSLLPACNWFARTPQVPVKLRLVNVLDAEQFNDAHIKGSETVASLNISLQDLEVHAKNWDKSVPVVTYCSNYFCTASGDAARRLTELGFSDVYAYEAGMADWYQLGQENEKYAVEGPAQGGYLKMKIKKPSKQHEDIKIITSEDLQKKIKDANLLDG